jgi:hypothetical protein
LEGILALAKWLAGEFPEVPVLIREHPNHDISSQDREELKRFSSIRLMPPHAHSLIEVMAELRMSVSLYSSTILESIAAGVFPLVLNLTSLPSYYPDIHGAGAGTEVKSIEAAKDVIRRALEDPAFTARFDAAAAQVRSRFFLNEPHPARKIADEIARFTA